MKPNNAMILCERLREMERDLLDDEVGRQFNGHVLPALARLESSLAMLAADPKPGMKPNDATIEAGITALRYWLEPNGDDEVLEIGLRKTIDAMLAADQRPDIEAVRALRDARTTLVKMATGRPGNSQELSLPRSAFDSAIRNIDKARTALGDG